MPFFTLIYRKSIDFHLINRKSFLIHQNYLIEFSARYCQVALFLV